MSIQYKIVKRTFGYDSTKTPRYVIKAVPGEKLSFDKVCLQVSQICGIHRYITTIIIASLLDVLVNFIDMGHSIQLGDFGILRPALRAKAQDSEEAATAKTIYRRRIVFIPGKILRDLMENVSVVRYNIPDTDYTDDNNITGNG